MTDYDSTLYGICISTAKTGSGTTAYPSDNRWFIVTDKISGSEVFMSKIKQIAGGYSYALRDGKRSSSVKLGNCPIVGMSTAFNTIIPFVKAKHASGGTLLYIWIKVLSAGTPTWTNANDTLYIGMAVGGTTATNYMSGYLTKFDWEIDGGMYWIKNAVFQESLG